MRLPAFRNEHTGNPALDRIQAGIRSIYEFLKLPQFGGPVEQFADQRGGWADILGQVVARTTGPNQPSLSAVNSSSFYENAFSVSTEAWMNFHVPHDLANSVFHFHVHWTSVGTNTNDVKWRFDYTYASGYGRGTFDHANPTTVYASEAPTGVSETHYITETAEQSLPLAEPDGIITCRISRVTNGGTDNTDPVFVKKIDAHYKSNGSPTKNRVFPFK